ncbi:MAG: hypothetical protein KY476_07960 [Planctomycetes bacterium]|nr:hypothetical protein [Planctomycetota bacterium]
MTAKHFHSRPPFGAGIPFAEMLVIVAASITCIGCSDAAPTVQATHDPPESTEKPQAKVSYRSGANPLFPDGNSQTLRFLAWAKERHGFYCSVRLGPDGECLEAHIHPCWPVTDDEVEVISELKTLESLSFYARWITDDGLRVLAKMPALKRLWMFDASMITDDALGDLKASKPDLQVELP